MNRPFYAFKAARHVDYFLTFVLLLFGLGATWYFFFNIEIIDSPEKLIAAVISCLGICLGLFQFSITQINSRKKRYFDLRYAFCQQIVQKVEMVIQTLHGNMTSKEIKNPHGLVTSLMNLTNELAVANNVEGEYLFPGLKHQPSSKELHINLLEILKKTDEFRITIEKSYPNPSQKEDTLFFSQLVWHNDIKELLVKLNSIKYDYYRTLQQYY